ncbi:MAG: peptidoglycan-binding domain-containing protein [Candidatus Acidiferrum sp.]
MSVLKATRLALTLLLAGGIGVSGAAAKQGTAKSSKTHSVKHRPKARHARYHRRSRRRARGQRAPTPERISEIQSALAREGAFGGTPNGKWDADTVAAMKKFQEAQGLNPTGKLDAKTLQRLGLGSQTAGLAPPLPLVSSSSLETGPPPIAPRQQ